MRRYQLKYLLLLAVMVSGNLCGIVAAQSATGIPVLDEAREKKIVQALLEPEWNAAGIARQVDPPPLDMEQVRLWQGNVPKIDIGFSSLDFTVAPLKEGGAPASTVTLDIFEERMRVKYSENTLPQFRGGAMYEYFDPKQVGRIFLPGKDEQGLLFVAPAWKRGKDMYVLVCPRQIYTKGQSRVGLRSYDWKLTSSKLLPYGRARGHLLSGASSGNIEAFIETSDGIPAPVESKDQARGLSARVELLYRPIATFLPATFPAGGKRLDRFIMGIDMRLPAGFGRKVIEEFDLHQHVVAIPEFEMAIPTSTVLKSKASSAVPHEARFARPRYGIDATVEAGPCVLIAGEHRPQIQKHSQEQTAPTATAIAP